MWGRIEFGLMALLTLSVYKTWIATELPKIGYHTKLDYYLTSTMILLVGVWTIQSCVLHSVCEEENSESSSAHLDNCKRFDYAFGLSFFLVWSVAHGVVLPFIVNLRPTNPDDRPYLSCESFQSCRIHRPWNTVMSEQINETVKSEAAVGNAKRKSYGSGAAVAARRLAAGVTLRPRGLRVGPVPIGARNREAISPREPTSPQQPTSPRH